MSTETHSALNIVTPHRVLRWNGNALLDLFISQSRNITAAKETRDGSNLLAVADGRLVLIHDIQESLIRRQHTTSEASGQMQLLAFAPKSQELYFTTRLQHTVRSYAVRHSVLRKSTCALPRQACVLAVSQQSLVAACNKPPVIIVQSLSSQESPRTIMPLPLEADIVCASFHLRYMQLLLLASLDGSVLIYKVCEDLQLLGNSRPLNDGVRNTLLVAASFLSKSPLSVVTVHSNKVVLVHQFFRGTTQLSRRWTTPRKPTCVSVAPATESNSKSMLAIGMCGGEVAIYNYAGVLQRHLIADLDGSDIIDLE